ncbi:F-UL0.5 protein [Chelonid alphaherpesvirus 5]|uniref:F-UL0.5 protein n=1 Tax=Chelonid alphaherpesvirus 5 TaxID=702736 RepID=V5NYP2_9ALPH|nr:F-UL0.5 protein [Chelonid alphaherpesvirus 5]AHA93318.1 F-UL0.5 protein [Chelonid alphaherpesvirus 5]
MASPRAYGKSFREADTEDIAVKKFKGEELEPPPATPPNLCFTLSNDMKIKQLRQDLELSDPESPSLFSEDVGFCPGRPSRETTTQDCQCTLCFGKDFRFSPDSDPRCALPPNGPYEVLNAVTCRGLEMLVRRAEQMACSACRRGGIVDMTQHPCWLNTEASYDALLREAVPRMEFGPLQYVAMSEFSRRGLEVPAAAALHGLRLACAYTLATRRPYREMRDLGRFVSPQVARSVCDRLGALDPRWLFRGKGNPFSELACETPSAVVEPSAGRSEDEKILEIQVGDQLLLSLIKKTASGGGEKA